EQHRHAFAQHGGGEVATVAVAREHDVFGAFGPRARIVLFEIIEEERLADGTLETEIGQEVMRPIRHRVFEADRICDGVEPTHYTTTGSVDDFRTRAGERNPSHCAA